MARTPTGFYDLSAGEFPQPGDRPERAVDGDFHEASSKARETRKRRGRCPEQPPPATDQLADQPEK